MAIPLVSVGDIVQVIVQYNIDEQVCLNVHHYRVETTLVGTTYQEQLGRVIDRLLDDDASLVNTWADQASTDSKITMLQVQKISPSRYPYVRQPVNKPGLIAPPSAPSVVCVSITKRPERAGKGKTGHTQIPGMPAASMTNGYWAPALVSALENLADAIFNPIVIPAGGELRPCLVQSDNPGAYTFLLATEVRNTIRAMHRRTVGLGI